MKSGIRTTEFWLSLIAIIIGALPSSGLLPDVGPWVQPVGLVTVVLGALGYTASRARLKSATAGSVLGVQAQALAAREAETARARERPYSSARSALGPILAGLLGLAAAGGVCTIGGCAGWQSVARDTLRGAYTGAKLVGETAPAAMHEQCMTIARKCAGAKGAAAASSSQPASCSGLSACQDARHDVEAEIIAVLRVLAIATVYVETGSEADAAGYVARVLAELAKLKSMISSAEVL